MNLALDSEVIFLATEAKKTNRLGADGLLKGAHIIGFKSVNKRTYTSEALQKAVSDKIYVGVEVFSTGHDPKDVARNNDSSAKIGWITVTEYDDKHGIIGDIQFNPKHASFEAVRWWINNQPNRIGLSHVALQVESKDGKVTEIKKPFSVDIVNKGATTPNGIFAECREELIAMEGVIASNISERMPDLILEAMSRATYNVKWPLQGPSLTATEYAAKLIPVLKDAIKELSSLAPKSESTHPVKENDMEIKDLTLDMLKKDRPDLISAIATESVAATVALDAKVMEATKDLPTAAKTAVFLSLVKESIAAGKDVAALVSDRKIVTEAINTTVVSTTVPAGKEEAAAKKEDVTTSKISTESVAALLGLK